MTPEQHKRIFGWLIAILVIYLVINKFTESEEEAPLTKTEEIVSSIAMNVTTKVLDKQKHSRLYAVTDCEYSVSPENTGGETVGLSEPDTEVSEAGNKNTASINDKNMSKVTASADHQPPMTDCTIPKAADDN